jgi:hypothetical protein
LRQFQESDSAVFAQPNMPFFIKRNPKIVFKILLGIAMLGAATIMVGVPLAIDDKKKKTEKKIWNNYNKYVALAEKFGEKAVSYKDFRAGKADAKLKMLTDKDRLN